MSQDTRAEREARQAAIRAKGKVSKKQHTLMWVGSIGVIAACVVIYLVISAQRAANSGGGDGPAVNQGTTGNGGARSQPRRATPSQEAEAMFASMKKQVDRLIPNFIRDATSEDATDDQRAGSLKTAVKTVLTARAAWATGIAKHIEAGGEDPRTGENDVSEADKKLIAARKQIEELLGDQSWDDYIAADELLSKEAERTASALAALPAPSSGGGGE